MRFPYEKVVTPFVMLSLGAQGLRPMGVINSEILNTSTQPQKTGSCDKVDYPGRFSNASVKLIEHEWEPQSWLMRDDGDPCNRVFVTDTGCAVVDHRDGYPNIFSIERGRRYDIKWKKLIRREIKRLPDTSLGNDCRQG